MAAAGHQPHKLSVIFAVHQAAQRGRKRQNQLQINILHKIGHKFALVTASIKRGNAGTNGGAGNKISPNPMFIQLLNQADVGHASNTAAAKGQPQLGAALAAQRAASLRIWASSIWPL